MKWDFFSFFLNSEEPFLQLNTNFLETNVVNILLLVGLLVYGYKVSFSVSLDQRQKDIIQTIENAQKDVLNASNYYYLAEKGFTQSLFWLQSWKMLYEKDKLDLVNTKYKLVKSGLEETFLTTENLVKNFENKAFLSLQRYILFLTSSRILRQFLRLPATKQSSFIKKTLETLGGQN
jgi:hypothetical protein